MTNCSPPGNAPAQREGAARPGPSQPPNLDRALAFYHAGLGLASAGKLEATTAFLAATGDCQPAPRLRPNLAGPRPPLGRRS